MIGPPLAAHRWLTVGEARLRVKHWIAFASIALAVALPWFWAISASQPQFAEYFFWKHNVVRFVSAFDHEQPWWFYVPVIATAMLPAAVVEPLKAHLRTTKELHERDLRDGYGDVELPHALALKYPKAQHEWGWKFVFPSHKLSVDPKTGVVRRHHVYENYVIRGIARAAGASPRQLEQAIGADPAPPASRPA